VAVGEGKGGNKGRSPKFSARPATLKSGSPFKHSQPLQAIGTRGTLIPLGSKYRGYKGW
jgi:hypothetical protein